MYALSSGTIRKLGGVNPISLMLNDLSENRFVCKHKSRRALEGILIQCELSTRTSMKEVNRDRVLGVGEQVDTLMALATDPNILVRQWQGLSLWL